MQETSWDIEGRRVRIGDSSAIEPGYRQRAIELIRFLSQKEHIFRHFPGLRVLFADAVPGIQDPHKVLEQTVTEGYTENYYALSDNPLVFLNIDVLRARSAVEGKNFDELVKTALLHELEHVFTIRNNDALIARQYAQGRLGSALRSYDQSWEALSRTDFQRAAAEIALNHAAAALRKELYYLLDLLLLEGTAMYAERFTRMAWSQANVYAAHLRGEQAARQLIADLDRRLATLQGLAPEFSKLSLYTYEMGLSMVYTTLYAHPQMAPSQIEKISPLQFIKMYEAAATAQGLQPLVSYTSGKGIFDYKREIERWWAVAQSILQRRPLPLQQ